MTYETTELIVLKAHKTADPGIQVVEFAANETAVDGYFLKVYRCQLQPGAPWPLRKSDRVTIVIPVATRVTRPASPRPVRKPGRKTRRKTRLAARD